jgi:putative transposase
LKKKDSSILRTYQLTHFANKDKQSQVFGVLHEYRKVCCVIAKQQWRLFFGSEKLDKMADLSYVNSIISERYKRNCAYQVDSQLQSFISNRQNDFTVLVHNSSLSKEVQIKLFQINRRKLWFKKEDKNFSAEHLFLARKIFKRLLKTNRKPNLSRCNMLLNSNVAKITPVDKSVTIGFDYWVQFATLTARKPIMIPIKSNEYFNNIKGELKDATQFNFNGNEFTVSFIKNIPKRKIEFKTDKISLDYGLKSLFTASDGKMFGKTFYPTLLWYDEVVSKLIKNLQKQKIKPRDSKRYKSLISSLRAYIKNEVNRVFNRIINLYQPKKINLERLSFKNTDLSKRLNRILSNCGRSVIDKKLESLKEVCGIEVALVNPAYTSQECSNCHYVDKKNRKSQEIFKCKNCRRSLNADVNGARVVDYRSSVVELANVFTNRKELLRKIVTLFTERNPRLYSEANGLLNQNPYFKDAMEKLKRVA